MNLINALDVSILEHARKCFECFVDREQLESYEIDNIPFDADVIVGLSGGADSSVLGFFAALYLAPKYPNLHYVFTDTKAEPQSCHETLDALEAATGIKIDRLIPEHGLFEMIDKYNGFLPNSQARWCTKTLKIEPLLKYLKQFKGNFVSLAGIRADEANRDGLTLQVSLEHNNAAFPFVDLGITKDMVFDILAKTVGVPHTYHYRGRSGCFSCFFQKNQEMIGMYINDPVNYEKTERAEKLCEDDATRWPMHQTLEDIGFAFGYPVPAFLDTRKPDAHPQRQPKALKATKDSQTMSLFGDQDTVDGVDTVFAAVALYVDDRLSWYGDSEYTPGTYWQEFVSVSTSLSGIKSAMGNYYKFRMTTPMERYDANDLKIVLLQFEFPKGEVDLAPVSKDSFTWKQKVSMKQLRHLVSHCQAVLNVTALRREFATVVEIVNTAPTNEQAEDAAEKAVGIGEVLKATPSVAGKLVWEGLYFPTVDIQESVQLSLEGVSQEVAVQRPRESLEFDEVPTACIACSF